MNRRNFFKLSSLLFVSDFFGESFSLNQIKRKNIYKNDNIINFKAKRFIKVKIPNIIVNDKLAQQYLLNIAKPLFKTSNRQVNWKIFLVKEKGISAYTIGAGLIVIDIDLIKLCTSEVELASVIAHEIGHNHHKHAEKRYMTDKAFQNLNLNKLDKSTIDILSKAFSKNNEREADAFIIKSFLKTGFDITKASSLFHKLQKMFPDNTNINHCLHSTHPLHRDRIKILEKVASTFSQNSCKNNDSREFKYLKQLAGA